MGTGEWHQLAHYEASRLINEHPIDELRQSILVHDPSYYVLRVNKSTGAVTVPDTLTDQAREIFLNGGEGVRILKEACKDSYLVPGLWKVDLYIAHRLLENDRIRSREAEEPSYRSIEYLVQ